MTEAHKTPSDVAAHNGDVLVDGPGGVAVSMTPDAAIETGERLIDAGSHAHGQRLTGQVGDLAK